jgi:hypothetical protein
MYSNTADEQPLDAATSNVLEDFACPVFESRNWYLLVGALRYAIQ